VITAAAPPPVVVHRARSAAGGALIGLVAAALVAVDPRLGLAAAAGVPVMLLTSIETKVVLYFVFLPLVGWLKVRFPATSVQGVPDLLALALLVHIGWAMLVRRLRLPVGELPVLLALLFAVTVVVQSQNPIIGATGEGIPGARVYLEPFVLFLAGLAVWRRPGFVDRWLRVVVGTATIVGLYGLKQLLLGFDASERAFQQESALRTLAEKKLFSTLPSPDGFGFVAAAFVIICVLAHQRGVLPRLSLVAAALCAIGVVGCGVRIALIGLVPALAITVLLLGGEARTRRLAFGAGGLLVAVGIGLGSLVAVTPATERDDSFDTANALEAAVVKLALLREGTDDEDYQGRSERLADFAAYITRHPLGAGPGLVKLVDANTELDPNVERPPLPEHILREPWIFQHDFYYFAVGVELGLAPLLLLVMLLLMGAAMAVDAVRHAVDPAVRVALVAAAAVPVLALVYNLTNEAFRTPQVAGYVWFLLALPVAWAPHLSAPRDLPR